MTREPGEVARSIYCFFQRIQVWFSAHIGQFTTVYIQIAQSYVRAHLSIRAKFQPIPTLKDWLFLINVN